MSSATGENTIDKCPKTEVACQDVINGSQCLAQIVMDNNPAISAESLAKCVQHEGTASNLPGATKVRLCTQLAYIHQHVANKSPLPAQLCLCPGCHTPLLNAAISKYFPPPCTP
ncbi:hypothetical protein QBC47DRAFT_311961 [Echria macrotheca]|uniref:Uncharacterized protein n=1 Tax=Echria macrotheca TaxID=438768 RepID=A0AAJ0F5Q4_9PEZI|nr:hypothetical protein QBC47DRAFT_311961 [Echria macrotheca]